MTTKEERVALRKRCEGWSRFIIETSEVLSMLDALDAQDAELTRTVTREQALAAVVEELGQAWGQGCEYALEASGHAVASAPDVYAANPYRKEPDER